MGDNHKMAKAIMNLKINKKMSKLNKELTIGMSLEDEIFRVPTDCFFLLYLYVMQDTTR